MGQRGRTTFRKRQREMANKEKQRAKAQRREERKTLAETGDHSPESQYTTVEAITGPMEDLPETETETETDTETDPQD